MLTGCPSDRYESAAGELGKGDLAIICVPEDAVCKPGQEYLDAPTPVAMSASFEMNYSGPVPKSATGEAFPAVLVSGSPPMLSKLDSVFTAWKPGTVAVLARTEQGTVLDFVHLRIAEIASIELTPTLDKLVVGEEQTITATATGPDALGSKPLAGSVPYSWKVENSGGVDVTEGNPVLEIVKIHPRAITVIAREPGQSILRASAGNAVGEMTVIVEAP